jgi:hypothetical protein
MTKMRVRQRTGNREQKDRNQEPGTRDQGPRNRQQKDRNQGPGNREQGTGNRKTGTRDQGPERQGIGNGVKGDEGKRKGAAAFAAPPPECHITSDEQAIQETCTEYRRGYGVS